MRKKILQLSLLVRKSYSNGADVDINITLTHPFHPLELYLLELPEDYRIGLMNKIDDEILSRYMENTEKSPKEFDFYR